MPNENTDQPITSLPTKVASGIAATDYMLGIDSAEGYRMLIQDLGDYIIQHATSSLAGSNQTLANVISTLDSNYIYAATVDALSTAILAMSTGRTGTIFMEGSVVNPITGVNAIGIGYVAKYNDTMADIVFTIGTNGDTYSVRFNPTAKTFGAAVKMPTRAEIGSTSLIGIGDGSVTGAISSLYDQVNDYYGFIEDCNTLSATVRITYIGKNTNYTPVSIGSGGALNMGSWQDFYDKLNNHPWMVKSDGTPDYQLSDTDYTKKVDGTTASDVDNSSYDGGAFAWIKKIYKYEDFDPATNKRTVMFSFTPKAGFEPVGFIDKDGVEMQGIWIPMFYGSIDGNGKARSISGTQPSYNKTTTEQNTAIEGVGTRAAFFGGGIVNTLTDIMIMMGKSTDTQGTFGKGNCSGYDASLSPTNGVKANAVVSGGAFYATTDAKSLNKAFHSVVINTWQQWQRDPYLLFVDGEYKVSKHYDYDVTGATYIKTGLALGENGGQSSYGPVYPHIYRTISDFGCVPVGPPFSGSTTTGGCDGLWVNLSGVRVSIRFGECSNGAYDGGRYLDVSGAAGNSNWAVGFSLLLLPPAEVEV